MTEKEILRIANGAIPPGWLDDRARFIVHFAQLVEAAEREACARVAEYRFIGSKDGSEECAWKIAAAIRARGRL